MHRGKIRGQGIAAESTYLPFVQWYYCPLKCDWKSRQHPSTIEKNLRAHLAECPNAMQGQPEVYLPVLCETGDCESGCPCKPTGDTVSASELTVEEILSDEMVRPVENVTELVERLKLGGSHPNSARFHEILTQLGELHDRKQQDYGRGDDPFANVRGSTEWGIPAWVGAMVRATDKVKRLQNYSRKGELANESVEDAFLDLAVYAVIAMVLWEQEEAPKACTCGKGKECQTPEACYR